MKAKALILPILFVVIGIATYWFYNQTINSADSASIVSNTGKSADNIQNQQDANVPAKAQDASQATKTEKNQAVSGIQDIQNKASNESLYELKSSIQGVIADSIQDEIQEAVENKIIKTDDIKQ